MYFADLILHENGRPISEGRYHHHHSGSNSNTGSRNRITDYDTGIGSSSNTITSPIGSPYGQIRSHVKTNGHFTSYMQVRSIDFYLYLYKSLKRMELIL